MLKKSMQVVLIGIAFLFLISAANGYRTKQKLVRYCRETTGGTLLASAREKAVQNGFRIIESSSDPARQHMLVTASGVMGRVVCEVEHDGERVIKTFIRSRD